MGDVINIDEVKSEQVAREVGRLLFSRFFTQALNNPPKPVQLARDYVDRRGTLDIDAEHYAVMGSLWNLGVEIELIHDALYGRLSVQSRDEFIMNALAEYLGGLLEMCLQIRGEK